MVLSNIKKVAESKRVTIVSVAEEIEMSVANLHRCIRENKIEAGVLEKIAHVLDVPVSVFFDEIPIKNIGHTTSGNHSPITGDIEIDNCKSELEKSNMRISYLEQIIKDKDKIIELLSNKK